jgi:haloalkane dehalogenase
MQTLRTPAERFAALPDFPYQPRYADLPDGDGGTLRMAWVEAGHPAAPPVLLLHGEPSWSFLYRHVIRELVAAGLRAVAVDLVGFGRSDKPTRISDHTYARHVEWTRTLVLDVLGLDRLTLVGQDWGGLIGLRLAAENPGRFAGIVAANTGLPTGDIPLPEEWHRFKDVVARAEDLEVSRLVQAGCRTELPKEVLDAYDAPFPDEAYKSGPRAMPRLVPTTPDDPAAPANRAAWQVLTSLDLPFLVAFSDADPITGGMAPILMRSMSGAVGRPHPVLSGAGHFLQEDAGTELGRHIARFVRTS